eukprot:scaffold217_cov377-Prasinococcus_capsulatus_cf.AAC.2
MAGTPPTTPTPRMAGTPPTTPTPRMAGTPPTTPTPQTARRGRSRPRRLAEGTRKRKLPGMTRLTAKAAASCSGGTTLRLSSPAGRWRSWRTLWPSGCGGPQRRHPSRRTTNGRREVYSPRRGRAVRPAVARHDPRHVDVPKRSPPFGAQPV